MNTWKFLLLTLCLFTLSSLSFGQSSADKNVAELTCDDSAKKVVWRWLRSQEWFDDFGKCSERLETNQITMGVSKGLVVRGFGSGMCGATGNCLTWILINHGARPKIIINVTAIKRIEIKRTKDKRSPLLLFKYNMSIGEHYVSTFRFRNNRLTFLRCQNEFVDTDGNRSISKVSSKHCRE